ncbi:hypothetical protein FNV43_RR03532 [Rhamnella rubrinervis]|uniref:Thioredoxin domain-containing protein n=1 Tax=Rhamnella rubrinervis TaxID=2594499 RepID=A0A8K0MPE1_9ROSA|nr:hypothetical protein FNV43_RR03532 [Rhamnella rubrinervis]
MKLLSPPPLSHPTTTRLFSFHAYSKGPKPISISSYLFQWRSKRCVSSRKMLVKASLKVEEKNVEKSSSGSGWEKVSAVLFDMDGVLCDSEEPSRRAAVDVFAELGVEVTVEDFVPFMGTGFNPEAAKKRFFEIYLDKYAKPNSGIGFPGALELITQCKSKGLKVAVASSADRIKVDANLAAAALPLSMFDAIVSADAFEKLKPAPDIFFAASKILKVPTSECIVIEDALAGVQAAKAAGMRCIAVTTTLSEETLRTAGPSLIRNDIGNVSLNDILTGGSDGYNGEIRRPEVLLTSAEYSSAIQNTGAANDGVFTIAGLQGSRRNILRYGSLGIAFSCLVFTITNWKAMQYASPKAIWNLLFGVNQPSFEQNEGGSRNERFQQFVNYISDLETRGTAPIVPEFPPKLDWLNTAPLKFQKDLKGKVVLLDFWTYCCINCMHVLPDLEFLEKKYKDMPFTVVGVHSAKFDNEKDLETIRNAVLRYGITHPVVNDGDMQLWRELGVNSWPTFALVGPNGKLLAQVSGEEDAGQYSIPLRLEKDNDPRLFTSPLKFPGKLAVDVLNNRLFISDSNHNRIVVTDLDGNFIVQIGSSGGRIKIWENHALREIDFVNESVHTLAGNGTKGSDYKGGKKGIFFFQLLNSPWDVCFVPVDEKVYIAMAGQHQIWEHNTLDGITRAFSGDGYERNLNGSSSTSTSFAQPSGISLSPDMTEIYVADSESSSIRALDLKTGGSRLLAGGDPVFSDNLFKFGDHDGIGSEVLLQHPLGVICTKDGQVYIADSYNHKIKKLDPASRKVSTLAGTGKAGFKDGTALSAQLSEPSGIIESENGRLYIADTNNNVIRYLDVKKEEAQLLTLELKGVQPPVQKSRAMKRLRRRLTSDTQTIAVEGSSSSEGNLSIKISVPEEYHFSKEAHSKFSVETEPENAMVVDPLDGYLSPEGSAVIHFMRSSPSASIVRINCKVYYCKEDEVCLYQSLLFEVPFQGEVAESTPAEITVSYLVKPKTSTSRLQLPVSP